MIIHPTRTNLLILKEKAASVTNSTGILKARRQALIREFFSTTLPFLKTRKEIVEMYGKAVEELQLSLGHMGRTAVESLTFPAARHIRVDIIEKGIWGLTYKDVVTHEPPVRNPDARGYDFTS
ncbi:MAG: V-type ATP synthase subunit D, partial [Nitrospirota bacterium]